MTKINESVVDLLEVTLNSCNSSNNIYANYYEDVAEQIADYYVEIADSNKIGCDYYESDMEFMDELLCSAMGINIEDFDDEAVDYDTIWQYAINYYEVKMTDFGNSIRAIFEKHLDEVLKNEYEIAMKNAIYQAETWGDTCTDNEDWADSFIFKINLYEEYADWAADNHMPELDRVVFYDYVAGDYELDNYIYDMIKGFGGIEDLNMTIDRGDLEYYAILWVANPSYGKNGVELLRPGERYAFIINDDYDTIYDSMGEIVRYGVSGDITMVIAGDCGLEKNVVICTAGDRYNEIISNIATA